jgi:cytochrome oxidase Cu insertion factor (SCO1/SenC/PrrC family)
MNEPESRVRTSRLKLLLVGGVFVLPLLVAVVLTMVGWQPGTRSHGTAILPQRSFTGIDIRMANGKPYAWRGSEPRWTLVALPGSDCMDNCTRLLHLMRNARITLNKATDHLRLLYVGQPPHGPHAATVMKDWQVGTDVDHKLEKFRPRGPDSVSAILVEPNGTALTRYRAGFDPDGLKDDLHKVVY